MQTRLSLKTMLARKLMIFRNMMLIFLPLDLIGKESLTI